MKKTLLPSLLIAGMMVLLSCVQTSDSYTREEVASYAKSQGIPENDLYFIKKELQQEYMDIGQPNTIVLDKGLRRLKAATCYEEFPYYLDTFNEFKSQVKDTLSMYDLKFDGDINKIFETIDGGENLKPDASKKYYIFYYFAKYAKSQDKKIKKGVEKYKDSVQYFFVNVDKIRE